MVIEAPVVVEAPVVAEAPALRKTSVNNDTRPVDNETNELELDWNFHLQALKVSLLV